MSMTDRRQNVLNINIGILGHVDSGKTSLVKALSTSLSTAALDKHPQSQQRGITLDLGFSSFTLPLPAHLLTQFGEMCPYDTLQFTLVDCPGHASLIRTIIGGAQIIDMIVLVVDANKGIQTQTAECIVIGEITSDKMIIALNKVDTIPEHEREEKVEKAKRKIYRVLAGSKFANARILPLSAIVGGEKVAAIAASGASTHATGLKQVRGSMGIEDLVTELERSVDLPHRNAEAPFYYSIDHCFSIKGHGTVLTGTVLSGSVTANSMIEIPHIKVTRKVKSMQMFHKPVEIAKQGDRVGICVTNLDAKLIERSIACAPNTVPAMSSAICLVKKVRFFKLPCKSGTKFHITVGHETVLGSVVFFGAEELQQALLLFKACSNSNSPPTNTSASVTITLQAMLQSFKSYNPSLHATFLQNFPQLDYPTEAEYLYQDEIKDTEGLVYGNEPVQWALIDFQHPIYCPLGSLIIGSKLDADTSDSRASAAHMCRLAFYGPLRAIVNTDRHSIQHSLASNLSNLGLFTWKEKYCEIVLLSDVRKGGYCFEVVAWKLVSERNSIQTFLGMKVLTNSSVVGTIVSAYGAEGQFRVKFKYPVQLQVGDKLLFRYRKYMYAKSRGITQEEYAEENMPNIEGVSINDLVEDEGPKGKGKEKKVRTTNIPNKQNMNIKLEATSESVETAMEIQVENMAALSAEVNTIETVKDASTDREAALSMDTNATVEVLPIQSTILTQETIEGDLREGKFESARADEDGSLVIVSGAFRMEENVKLYIGSTALGPKGERGEVSAAFGKLGKCKVKFLGLDPAALQSGDIIRIYAKLS